MENKSILIVEDDDYAADSLKIRLKSIGFRNSHIVNTGEDAIDFVRNNSVDILLMDINLIGLLDGIDAAEKIRSDFEIPVIFLTASKDESTWKRAKLTEPFAYLFKPFDIKDLQVTIEMALYKHEAEQKLRDSEIRYRSVVEDMVDMIWRFSDGGFITFSNIIFNEFFSLKNGITVSNNLFAMLSKENAEIIKDKISQITENTPVIEFGLQIKLIVGRKYLKLSLRKLFQSTLSPVEYQVVAKDVTEEVQAQEVLVRNEEYYRKMFEEGLSADFITSADGKLIDCNNQFLALYGFPSKEIAMQTDMYSLYPAPGNREELLSIIKEKGQLINLEVPMGTFDGRSIYVLSNMIGVFNENNNLVKIRGYEIDITDKKKAEKALIESEEQARSLFNGNTDPIFISDLMDKCVALNPAFTKLFGYTLTELYGQKFPGHKNLDEGKFEEWLELCRQGVGVSDYETVRISKKGVYIPVSLSVSPLKDTSGNVRLLSFWYRDISERKQIEAEKEKSRIELEIKVRERTAELRAMYEQSPIGMCIVNGSGQIEEINEAWNQIWNNNTVEPKYCIFDDPYFQQESMIDDIRFLFEYGGDLRLQPIFYDGSNKTLLGNIKDKWLKHTFYSIESENKSVNRIVNLVEDVSESKRADEISERYEKQRLITATIMETLEQERKRLSKEIHDGIGQMLTVAKMRIEFFEKETNIENEKLKDAKKILYNIGVEVENLINALRPDIFDNYGLIKSLEIMCRDFQELTGIEINYNAYDFSGRFDHNFELNLYRIVQEAISNIAKHSKATKASIQIFNRGNTISVIIEDNGKGFEIDFSKKEELRKAGFGLLSMIERAEQMGGQVYFESALDKGTEIHIEIPHKKETESE